MSAAEQVEHLRLVGALNVEALQRAVHAWLPGFEEERWRQDTPGSPHVDTKTLFLRMPPVIDLHSVFSSLDVVDLPAMGERAFRAAVEFVCALVAAPAARVMIVMLRPGGAIRGHVDQGAYADATDRYHLCISSNELSWMAVGGHVRTPKPGECWFFDKHVTHLCKNQGETWRTHMIVDCWRP